MKLIAVDLDDTLNDFSQTLASASFPYAPDYGLSAETFAAYLDGVRTGRSEESLLSTEYSYFRYRIHEQCYRLAAPRPDGVRFMRWLKEEGWTVVICTYRDLRRANASTTAWLAEHGIPYDHLFMAHNKIVFCSLWGIRHLVDDDPFNITYGARYGVQVYYPVMGKHDAIAPTDARGFTTFDEVRQWIQE